MIKRVLLAGVMLWAVAHTPAHPAEFTLNECGPKSDCKYIKISGQIVTGDDVKFQQMVDKRGYNPTMVVLDSPGGTVIDGMIIARNIHEHGYITTAWNECTSICAAMWLAGSAHYLPKDLKIGFHTTSQAVAVRSRNKSTTKRTRSAFGNMIVDEFYRDMRLGKIVRDALLAPGPDDMLWAGIDDLKEIGIQVYPDENYQYFNNVAK
jgi:hypothetical protein